MGNDWKKVFENPGKEYRSAPFWAWNEKINDQESKFQIQEMSDKGMGGFFIHSREGLETPYRRLDETGRCGCPGSKRKRHGSLDI